MTKKPCVLITGAAGFIANALIPKLRSDLPVIGIDSFTPDVHPLGMSSKSLLKVLYAGSVTDTSLLDHVLKEWHPESIYHLAAETGTGKSASHQSLHVVSNVLGTSALLEALERNQSFPKQIVLTSSRAVYGDGLWIDNKDECKYASPRTKADLMVGNWNPRGSDGKELVKPLSNSTTQMPSPGNVYALTKLSQEKLVEFWCDRNDVAYKILRLQNVYGPGQSPNNPYTGIVNIFSQVAFAKQPIDVYEDGNIVRDFVYIDDVANALLQATRNGDGLSNGYYDIGTGVQTTIHELALLIAELEHSPKPRVSGKFRHGDVRSAFANPSTFPPGWQATTDLETGIRATLASLTSPSHLS